MFSNYHQRFRVTITSHQLTTPLDTLFDLPTKQWSIPHFQEVLDRAYDHCLKIPDPRLVKLSNPPQKGLKTWLFFTFSWPYFSCMSPMKITQVSFTSARNAWKENRELCTRIYGWPSRTSPCPSRKISAPQSTMRATPSTSRCSSRNQNTIIPKANEKKSSPHL